MKEARRKRRDILWFHLYRISRKGKSIHRKEISGFLELRIWGYEQVLVTTNQERYFGGILKLDCGDGCTTVLLKSLWYKCKMAEYFMVCSKSQKAV